MTVEPQKVEPGFAKRWTKQSLALILRSPIIWGFIILSFFMGSKIIEHSIWYIFLGGFLLMLSLEFAAFTDFYKMNVHSFFECIKVTWKHYIEAVKERKGFLILFSIFVFIINRTFDSSEASSDSSMFTSLIFSVLFGYVFINNGSHLNIFSYPLKRAFDSDAVEAINATCMKASIKNPKVFLFFELVVFMGMVFIGSLLPFLGIIYAAFLPCLIYVAFREIFWGKRENQTQEELSAQNDKKLVTIKN